MKLLIALTPGILIGCAFVETCASIITRKPSAPDTRMSLTAPPRRQVPVFALGGGGPAGGALAVARLQVPSGAR